ncbi:hypothetical protein [Chryseobacterium vrystaatense]|uniref:Right handed beta helix region n=1 Tax=Chryseobacterium vrystaatense TaxID=307480 RepID=A0A1M4WS03_9FLAO|nr:hypothetical protein [Chryseobacterium vrystaatense]SHE83999.1 hypothetical protein SAMN02787073_1235 [Chryseobacterium vrystaatense]
MTNCNSQKFPSTCNPADYGFNKFFPHTGEEVYYQKINETNLPEDGVVLIQENGLYYKAILHENTINIEWYRCNERYANDEEIILAAVKMAAYLGATLRFDAREYIVNRQLTFQNLSCFKLLGDKQHTVIKSNSNTRFPGYYFSFNSCANFIIDGIRFDQNKRNITETYSVSDYPNDYNGGIFIKLCSNLEICNSYFYDLYTRAITIYDCRGEGDVIKVNNNYFESGVQNQKYRMEHLVFGQSQSVNFIIENNIFKNEPPRDGKGNPLLPDPAKMPSGIGGHDCGYWGSVLVNNNVFEYCGRNNDGEHRLFAIDFYDNVNNFIISNNIFRNTTWGAIRFDGTKKNASISDNYIHQLITNDSGIINASARVVKDPYENSFKNISICNNIIEGVIGNSYGIGLQSQEDSVVAENINILSNTFSHLRTAVNIGGSIMGMNISNNNASDMSGPVVEYYAYSTTITVVNSNTVIKTPRLTAPLGNILISNNNFKASTQGNEFVGISIRSYTPQSKEEFKIANDLTKRFVISNNLIYGNGNNYGIVTDITTPSIPFGRSLDGKVTISGNEISYVRSGLYLRCDSTIAKDNILSNCSILPIEEDSLVTNIKFQNYYNNSPI